MVIPRGTSFCYLVEHTLAFRIVNLRWEELRAMALHRQTKLQTQLNHLQTKQLTLITRWLTGIEKRMTETDPVAMDRKRILEQIDEHTALQNEIEEFQPNILALNSFVAVVDDGESAAESVSSLEKSMREIGDRWQGLCGWAETRSTQLDGLADIVTETGDVYDRLSYWLKEREHDLLGEPILFVRSQLNCFRSEIGTSSGRPRSGGGAGQKAPIG